MSRRPAGIGISTPQIVESQSEDQAKRMKEMKDNKRDKRVLIPRDEFEEEAGEGLGRLSRDEAEADLRELRARLERRLRRPRAIWLPAAAAVVILLVGSALLVTMLRQRPVSGPELAQAEETVTDTAYIAMASPVEKKGMEAAAQGSGGTAAATSGNTAAGTVSGTAAVRTKGAKFGPLLSVTEEVVDEEKVIDAVIADDEVVSEGREAADDVVFLVVQEVAEEVVVQVVPQMANAAAKSRAETADRAAAPAAAGKKEAAAVEGVTAGRKDAAAVDSQAGAVPGAGLPDRQVSPVGGWSGYREWVVRNISYPDDVRPVVRQEVMVSFTVRPDSTLSDMKALRSPGEAFTREALRLLREGPKWVPSSQGGKAMAADVKVMFVFK